MVYRDFVLALWRKVKLDNGSKAIKENTHRVKHPADIVVRDREYAAPFVAQLVEVRQGVYRLVKAACQPAEYDEIVLLNGQGQYCSDV